MKTFLSMLLFAATLAAQWTELSNTAITTAICPADGASGSVDSSGNPYPYQYNCPESVRAWSGGVARTKAGSEQLLVLGGGHGDYGGNEVYSLNLNVSPPTITRLTNPSQITVSDFNNNVSVNGDGNPSSRHTYDWLTYIPTLDKVFMFSGSRYGGVGSPGKDGWLFDPTNNTWTAIVPNGAGYDPSVGYQYVYGSSVWDSNSGLVFIISSGYFVSLDLATSTYTLRSTSGAQMGEEVKAVVDTRRKRIVAMGGDHAYTLDITPGAGYTTTEITSSVDSSCSALLAPHGPGLHYDEGRDQIIGWPLNGGGTVYTMSPVTFSCRAWAYPTGPTSGTATHGMWGRFGYFPSLGKFAAVNDFGVNAFTFAFPTSIEGLGASTLTCVDKDGDGYGTGASCTGPDADDEAVGVHAAAQAISAYGSIPALYNRKGYFPVRYWILDSANGNNGTGASCTPSTWASCLPYQNWAAITASVAPGDAVVWRGGTYNAASVDIKSGTSGAPIFYLGYPGETVLISNASGQWNLLNKSWVVIDGVKNVGASSCMSGGTNDAIYPTPTTSEFRDNILRHIEADGCGWGFSAFNGLSNLLLEENSFHDSATSHGLYIGSRAIASAGVVVRRNLLYGNYYTGMQFNGRCDGCVFESNISYHNYTAGLSLEQGVHDSFVFNNILTDNGDATGGKQLNLSTYDGTEGIVNCGYARDQVCTCAPPNVGAICPFNQTNNTFSNNVFYNSGYDRGGSDIAAQPLIQIGRASNCTTGTCLATNMGYSTWRNNLIVTAGATNNYYPPMVYFNGAATPDPAASTTIQGMIFKQLNGRTGLIGYGVGAGGYGYAAHTCAEAASHLSAVSNCSDANPLFTATGAWNNMAGFNFRLATGSPAIHTGSTMLFPVRDSVGTAFSATPSLGAYEYGGQAVPIAPTITSTSPLPAGTVGQAYSQQLTATGDATITWEVISGTTPNSVILSSSGLLSGTPDTAGVYNFTVRATNTAGIADAAFSLSIANVTSSAARIIRGRVTLRGRVIQ